MTVEQAKELLQTKMWEGYCAEINKRIEVIGLKLRNCRHEELRDLQRDVLALEMCKHIPQDVIDREEDE